MLKFANLAQIGDTIRAYDFKPHPDRPDRFVEGRVIAKGRVHLGHDVYTIVVTRDGDMDENSPRSAFHSRLGQEVYVPFEVSLLEWAGRVSLVGTQPDPLARRLVSECAKLLEQHGDYVLGDL